LKIEKTNVGDYIVEGYEKDYVFNTIKEIKNFYEISILDKWTPFFSNANIIFDVGANLGNHTLYWADRLKCERIFSFEPYKPTFDILKRNIVVNNLPNVTAVNKGVGKEKGVAGVAFFDESNLGSTTLKYMQNSDDNSMEMIDLDSFVIENNIGNIDFIKIDVESFELQVLDGMKNILTTMKPDIWIEVGSETFNEVIKILGHHGYEYVDIEGFNMLFLNKSKHESLVRCSYDKILENMFIYLTKTNGYYKNYITAKKWVSDKNQKIILLENKLQSESEKSKKLTEMLIDIYGEINSGIQLFKENKAVIRKLESQNNYLKHENAEYRRKLSMITDTFAGKLGLKGYKILKKIKGLLR
jgi:methyltransferase, FkbM family